MTRLQKILAWLKKYSGWILAGTVAIIAIVFSFNRTKIVTKTDRIKQLEKEVVKAENEVNFLMGKKEMLKDDYAENEKAIIEIDKKLENLDNQLKLKKLEIQKRTMEENLERFKELGY